MVIVPLVLALESIAGRRARLRDLLLLLAAPAAYVAWGAVVWLRSGSTSTGGNVGPPFVGLIEAAPCPGCSRTGSCWRSWWPCRSYAVVREPRSTLAHLIEAYWVFALFLSQLVWEQWAYFSRILLPVAVLAVVVLIPGRRYPPSTPAEPTRPSSSAAAPTHVGGWFAIGTATPVGFPVGPGTLPRLPATTSPGPQGASKVRFERSRRAHHPAAGPQGPPVEAREGQDAGAEGRAPASWRVHPRVHEHPEEAELRPAQGRPCAPDQRHRGHRLHPR